MIATDGGDPSLMRELLAHQATGAAQRITASADAVLACEEAIYFPIDAIASVSLAKQETGFQLGFAAKGDAIGIQRVFAPEFPHLSARLLKGGSLIRVTPEVMRRLMKDDSKLKDRLAGYTMRSMGRYLDGAASALARSIERRVAQWIVDYRQILACSSLPVTHQQIASALGVRRSGVTVALHVLEGEHLLRSRRARIEVLDAALLQRFGEDGSQSMQPDRSPSLLDPRAVPDPAWLEPV